MTVRRPARLLAAAAAIACCAAAPAGPAPKPAPADLAAFENALPSPGRDRVFLALPADLEARLAIDPAVVRAVDPGVACDPDAYALSMSEGNLGLAGHVQTTCSPDHHSHSLLTLADGSAWVTVCGAAAAPAAATASARHQPAHDCSGWTKLAR